MAINFPDSPTIGDEFTGGGFTWTWNGSSWEKLATATTNGTGFSLLVGLSGNTTYNFSTPQPAGSYSISSALNDTTFDTYLITSTNENAGYASGTEPLEASAEFNRVVIYGATSNDVLNFEYKPSSAPATSGDVDDGAAPFLTSATPTTLESVDDTTIVTGGNFASDIEIVFTGQDAVDRAAKNIVRSSSTSLIVTRPDDFPVAQEPYSMTATNAGIPNPSIVVNKLTDYFDAGGGVSWITTSPLPNYTVGSPYSTTFQAADADGVGVTYSLSSGTLPDGLTLDSGTGILSGTPTGTNGSAFNITILATDAGGNTSDREFSIATNVTVNYVVVAGGGGGGVSESGLDGGGGGGAGGYRSSISGELSGANTSPLASLSVAAGDSYTVSVGAGGAGAPTNTVQGSDGGGSSFYTVSCTGGGGGGSDPTGASAKPNPPLGGRPGGSGGGTAHDCNGTNTTSGGSGTSGEGHSGGRHSTPACNSPRGGAGGGGAGGSGGHTSNPYSSPNDGRGGLGLTTNVTGSPLSLAGGGVGGCQPGVTTDGRLFGGGFNTFGTTNTGGGGGARCANSNGYAGGSGIVLLEYPDTATITVGPGLTEGTTYTVGNNKVTEILAGTGNVSWS